MNPRGPSLFDQLRVWSVSDVAARLGLAVDRRGRSLFASPCPLCSAATRHTKTKDKRGALGLRQDGRGWRCFQCDAHGDAAKLAAAVVCGTTTPPPERWADVRRRCAELGLCEPDPRDTGAAPAVAYVPPPPRVMEEAPPVRPPASELRALWDAALPLDAVPSWEGGAAWCGDVRTYIASRGFDVMTLAGLDVARILPPKAGDGTAWWPAGWADRWRLAVLAYEANGEPATLQARAVDGSTTGPKTRNPLGLEVRGALFADGLGRAVLAGTFTGPGIVVVEGLTDFLTASQLVTEFRPEARPAVLGVVAGSAAALAGVCVAERVRLNVLTDNDDTGDRYFKAVAGALSWLNGSRIRLNPLGGKRADLTDWMNHDRRTALAALSHGMEVATYAA